MLEEQFFLVKHLGMNLNEVLSMPVQYRKWWIQRQLKFNDMVAGQNETTKKKLSAIFESLYLLILQGCFSTWQTTKAQVQI